MDFVHCNACQDAPCAESRSFWFTSCTHIFCKKCVGKLRIPSGAQIMCVLCKKPCNVIEIGPNLPPKVKKLFTPIEKTMQQQRAILKKALGFQEEQLKSLMEFAKKERDMLMKAMKANHQAKGIITKITKEKTELQSTVESHRKRLEEFEKHIKELQSSISAGKRTPASSARSAHHFMNGTSQSDPTCYNLDMSMSSVLNSSNESSGSFHGFLSGGGGTNYIPMASEPSTPLCSQMSVVSEMTTPKILGLPKAVRGENPYLAMWNRTSVERQKRTGPGTSTGNRNKSMDAADIAAAAAAGRKTFGM
ncbi:hypothetical protein PFISCL1PPCAC_25640 [Pristionchus fissidentatus]|uniref:RING-type domain-containing protein n=1 Tax=Pristionchus fissidentatus TaxID=1538716 RepID=A0AAV5WUM8_9BILA|nr:hypothetical protein PFISCL1PPCAC_25640 [Pristionchus fissidentatus]